MLTENEIKKYLDDANFKHSNYSRTVEIAEELQIHSKGNTPDKILDLDRPNEPIKYKNYRKDKYVFSPKTKSKWGQISSTTDKIVMAEDWNIKFNEPVSKIKKGESLEEYTTKNYPYFDSVINWYFAVGKKAMEDDPNSVVAIYPMNPKDKTREHEYLKPFAYIYPSECVIDYREGEFCAILCKEKTEIIRNKVKVMEGRKYLFFDRDTFILSEQVGEEEKALFEHTIIQHKIHNKTKGIRYMPAFRLGGIVEAFEDNQIIYNSFYQPVIPDFNEAIARYSDHQVNMALHLHPDRWELATHECKACKGNGVVTVKSKTVGCDTCGGVGSITVKSPFGVTTVKPTMKEGINEYTAVNTPPAGYIQRPIESIKFLKQEHADLIQSGFDSLNLGLINKEPEVNSGIAKVYDRQEASAFYRTIGRHIVENNLKPIFFFINEWRYGILLNEKEREDNLPIINVPTRFDILTAEIAAERLKFAIESKFDSTLVTRMQIEYAERELGKDSLEVVQMKIVSKLDPLPNKTEEEKFIILSNRGTTEESYVLSSNIAGFISRAINEDPKFLDLDILKQKEKLMEYTREIIQANKDNVIPITDFNEPGATANFG